MSQNINAWHLKRAVEFLRHEGLIAYPTEAVYGLGCDPHSEKAIKRLLACKQRRWQKGLILIAATFPQLEEFIEPLPRELEQKLFPTWPGPVTWLLPAKPRVSRWLKGHSDLIAVRVTAHPQAQALCQCWGNAVVSTSANRSGQRAAKTAFQVRRQFGAQLIDYILPGSVGTLARPTEIRHALTNTVLRT